MTEHRISDVSCDADSRVATAQRDPISADLTTMRKLSWLVIGFLCLHLATPTSAAAQQKENAEDFMKDVLWSIFGPNWNVSLQGGFTTTDRFLLQAPVGGGGQQSVQSNTGYNIGVGAGVDYLLRQGFRFYYIYSHNSLDFRTNNGNGTSNLDVDPDAKVHGNTLGVELIRYLLPARTKITPYGTFGVVGTWWGLDESPLVIGAGGSSQFRWGANLAFGLQVREWEKFGARLEAASITTGNPFTGKHSFRTTNAVVIDEPTSVGRMDWRLVGVYYFRKRSELFKNTPRR